MSIFDYLFDSDYQQRRDIEELRAETLALQARSSGPSDSQFNMLAAEVKELAATVHVMMRTLAAHDLLDIAKLKEQVAEELKPKPKPVKAKEPKPARAPEPSFETKCARCGTPGLSNEMVKAGADFWCRPCARNP